MSRFLDRVLEWCPDWGIPFVIHGVVGGIPTLVLAYLFGYVAAVPYASMYVIVTAMYAATK